MFADERLERDSESGSTLELVHQPEAYFEASHRRVFRGRRFACARSHTGVFGLVAWGRLMKDDAEELITVLNAATHAQHARRQLVDLREVQYLAPAAMRTLTSYLSRSPDYLKTVSQEAVVRQDSLVGIFAEGLYRVVPMPFTGRVFCHLDLAFSWLGDDVGWPVETANLITRHDPDPLIARLRRVVIAHGAGLSLGDAAHAVAMSARTLQRHLRRLETTWPSLRRWLIIEEAQASLIAGDHDLTQLALRLGFSSRSRFDDAFRCVTGKSSSMWLKTQLLIPSV